MTPQLLLSMLNDDADNDDGAADYDCYDNAGYGDIIDNYASMITKDAYQGY